jgi:hypothetical protein
MFLGDAVGVFLQTLDCRVAALLAMTAKDVRTVSFFVLAMTPVLSSPRAGDASRSVIARSLRRSDPVLLQHKSTINRN